MALVVGALTLFSMSKIWMEAFWKKPVLVRATPRTVPMAFLIPIALLGAVTLGIGLFADPFIEYARVATAALVDPAQYIAEVLPGLQPAPATGLAEIIESKGAVQ